MSEKIKINQTAVEDNATGLSGAATYFQGVTLIPTDGESTITANGKGQEAFGTSQRLIASFGETLEQEVTNVRSIGAAFEEYDKMMSQLWENGCRYETISAKE